MFDTLMAYLHYPFIQYAFIVGIFISIAAGLLGSVLVLKNYSFIGDGLSHVAFLGTAFATLIKLSNNMLIILPLTIILAILLMCRKQKVLGDSLIAVISVSALGIGYFIMNMWGGSTNLAGDVCGILFGATSILTLSITDVILCVALSIVVILFFVLGYHKIFSNTYDEIYAKSTGMKVGLYNLFLSVIVAIIIVLAMNLVGSLLVTALIVFPALSAMSVTKSYKATIISVAIISVIETVVGLSVSIMINGPVGATILVVETIVLFIFMIIGKIKNHIM